MLGIWDFSKRFMAQYKQHHSWYVLHARSRCENNLHYCLERRDLESFLPKIRVPSKRKDRKLMIQKPLFPGYTFVRTNLDRYEHYGIVKSAGFVRIIGNRMGPLTVPEEAVDSLKIIVATGLPIVTGCRFRKKERVMVVSGPFAGVTGYFSSYRSKGRVIVNIDALNQFASVEIEEDDIESLPEILR